MCGITEIYSWGNNIFTNNYFKPTDVNSYIGFNSCHFFPCSKNIHKGQFKRIRRNCTTKDNFQNQSQTIKKKCLAKGYDKSLVENSPMAVNSKIEQKY